KGGFGRLIRRASCRCNAESRFLCCASTAAGYCSRTASARSVGHRRRTCNTSPTRDSRGASLLSALNKGDGCATHDRECAWRAHLISVLFDLWANGEHHAKTRLARHHARVRLWRLLERNSLDHSGDAVERTESECLVARFGVSREGTFEFAVAEYE